MKKAIVLLFLDEIDLIWDSWGHIGLKQPQNYKFNFEAKIRLNFKFKFLLYEELFFRICCYEMKCPYVLKKIYHNFFSTHGVLVIVTQQSIKNRVETPSRSHTLNFPNHLKKIIIFQIFRTVTFWRQGILI